MKDISWIVYGKGYKLSSLKCDSVFERFQYLKKINTRITEVLHLQQCDVVVKIFSYSLIWRQLEFEVVLNASKSGQGLGEVRILPCFCHDHSMFDFLLITLPNKFW